MSRATMECPHCGRATITFRQWCSALNALRWTCPRCFAGLRASRRTKIALVTPVLVMVAIVAGVISAETNAVIPEKSGRLILGIVLVAALYPIGFAIFRLVASYEVASLPVEPAWPAGDEEFRDPDS